MKNFFISALFFTVLILISLTSLPLAAFFAGSCFLWWLGTVLGAEESDDAIRKRAEEDYRRSQLYEQAYREASESGSLQGDKTPGADRGNVVAFRRK